MQVVSYETKVCSSCRGAYYSWIQNKPEFNGILSRIEQEILDDGESDAEGSGVN